MISSSVSKVYQTDFTFSKGNALQACVASIFNKKLEEVPNFIESKPSYIEGINNWLVENGYKLKFQKILVDEGQELEFNDLAVSFILVTGKSPRGDHKHVIVGEQNDKKINYLHDVHPDESMIEGSVIWIGIFTKNN